MNKKMMRQLTFFALGAVTVIMIPQVGEQLAKLFNKTLTYGS